MPEKFVRDLMQVGVPTCKVTDPLTSAAQLMVKHGTDTVIVLDEDRQWAGLITEAALVKAYPYHYEEMTVEDIMLPTSAVKTVPPDIPASAAVQLMMDWGVSHAFVMHGGGVTAMMPSAVLSFRSIIEDMAAL